MQDLSLILASGSPRRRELLSALGLKFEVRKPGDDVEPVQGDYRNLDQAAISVENSARAKAIAVARECRPNPCNHLIIGADTIVRYGKHSLGKPHDAEEARSMLRSLSGRWHYVISGICVCRDGGEECRCAHSITKVRFRKIDEEEISAYVATGIPMDKAGAYGIQDFGSLFLNKLEGCYFNVMGLPLSRLDALLKMYGVRILGH